MDTALATVEQAQYDGLSIGNSQLLYIADQAQNRIAAMNTIKQAALKSTNHLDWINIGDSLYLQGTGAEKIGRALGVSWEIPSPQKTYDDDGSGHYTYQFRGMFFFVNSKADAFGMRSTRDEFFIGSATATNRDGTPKPQKKPQDVDERDVMQAAYTNCLNNGIKRILGIRNIDIEDLRNAGIDVSKLKGYGFNSGAPAEMTGEAKNHKAEIERMLKVVYGEKWTEGLKLITAFTGRGGNEIPGKTDINKLSENMISVTYGKVKANYEKWVKEHGQPDDSSEADSSRAGEDSQLPM